MTKKINMAGKVYNRLTIIEEQGNKVIAECECGKIKTYQRSNVLAGYTMSCGCLRNLRIQTACTTHGQSKTPLYNMWKTMHRRCDTITHDSYPWYGGKGIKVCERWKDFSLFYLDMGDAYKEGLSIDRIDPAKDYCPENCRWLPLNENRIRGLHGTPT